MKTISIRIDGNMYALLQAQAEAAGSTVAGVARDAIQIGLAGESSATFTNQSVTYPAGDMMRALAEIRALSIWALASRMSHDAGSLDERIQSILNQLSMIVERAQT